jgi:hypothetical protein
MICKDCHLTDYSSEGIKGVDTTFTVKRGRDKQETTHYWAIFSVKRDSRRGDEYIDVLVGSKGKRDPHIHIGINFDQSRRFVESRDRLVDMRRRIDSKLKGKLVDETITYSNKPARSRFTFKITIDEPTRTITPVFEESSLEELK